MDQASAGARAARRHRPRRGPGAGTALALALLAGACDSPDPPDPPVPPVAFDTAAARVETASDTFRLSVDIAETEDQRGYGLMERTSMPEDHGMMFLYSEPQDSTAGFYMYRTRIPLDIAFLDADGRIVAIRAMQPCESPYPATCPIYRPGAPYSRGLEVNRGYFERHGVEVGDRVVLLRADGGERP